MKQTLEPASHNSFPVSQPVRPPGRGRTVALLCLTAWTVFVVLALWWLLRADSGPSVFIIRDGEPAPQATLTKFRAWSIGDPGVQRVYPWVLLGPYVALIALCFPLERRRLSLSLSLNLAACAGFVAASHAINHKTGLRSQTVIFLKQGGRAEQTEEQPRTNGLEIQVRRSGQSAAVQGNDETAASDPEGPILLERQVERLQNVSPGGISNLMRAWPPMRRGAPPGFPSPGLPRLGLLSLLLDLLAYCAIVGLAHSVHYYQRFRERERQALLLESNLAQARLNALRAQLQPHFLFNSLNAIAALLRRDPGLAEATLMSLSELLRLALRQSEQPEVPLREEMNLVDCYLQIQQIRFGDRLRLEQQIDPATLECLVPTLLLQPVIENAIRHGIEPGDKPGWVRLGSQKSNDRLVLTVEDNGVGWNDKSSQPQSPSESLPLPTAAAVSLSRPVNWFKVSGTGIGLANLRARLETLYGPRQRLELTAREQGGARVRIEIPWRLSGPSELAQRAAVV